MPNGIGHDTPQRSGITSELIMNYRLMYLCDKMANNTTENESEYHSRRMKEYPPQNEYERAAYEILVKEAEDELCEQ